MVKKKGVDNVNQLELTFDDIEDSTGKAGHGSLSNTKTPSAG